MDTPGRKMMLIINPISGNGNKDGLAEKIADRLAPAGIALEVRETSCRGDATNIAREAIDRQFDAVLACGGDGTVNETARAVRDTGMTMGIIPAGSGNGLARHLAIPVDPILSLDVILQDHRENCDYGTVNGQPFFCTFGVGYDAAVSLVTKGDRASYYPCSRDNNICLVLDRKTGRLLGAQALGSESVAGRMNVFATAITCGMTVQEMNELDLVYSPSVAPVYDPILIAASQAMKKVAR